MLVVDKDYEKFLRLFYLDNDGILRWRIKRRKVSPGDIAGCDRGDGYIRVIVDYKPYFVHRIVFLLVNGHWPRCVTDHENRDRGYNHPDNLRDVSKSVNGLNRGPVQKDTY